MNTMTTTKPEVTLREFYARLGAFDWWYEYSDDPGVWRRGNDGKAKLRAIAGQSPEHAALFKAWEDYQMRNGPKPEVPA